MLQLDQIEMDKVFAAARKFLKRRDCVIDNAVFRLHYQATTVILIAFSIVVTSKQYIGDPIDCISRDDIPSKVLDTFCWVHATFSLPEAWHKNVGSEVPYPGVDKYKPGEKRIYHAYYQWVCFMLFFQAILFFAPHYLWTIWEGDCMRQLMLEMSAPIMDEEKKKERRKLLAQYLVSSFKQHNMYAFEYFLCEFFNLINVVGQIFFVDAFLGGEFSQYGIKVVQFTEWDSSVRYDPMIEVFPRLTKCTFYRFGSSGDVQRHDAMCILPINIVNEKIYIFLWFWFLLLGFVSAGAIIYRIVLLIFPRCRYFALRPRARLVRKEYFDIVMKRTRLGDWFILSLLCKNMDSLNYRGLMAELARRLEARTKDPEA
ncbi:innexin inx2-like [Centruroides sculpturatus]|uniref:innexin inx2-like n=1 Tax=Centruroides sculpturatus TaxID=218467 RepID=UPI000C6DA0EA|nr:innexin inx2-like [Centruroides sculpturatus]XP_023237366.1 innexin inx2-like [Centruroides sculpturatus]